MSKMNVKVEGLIGVVSNMSNWNADFDGSPKCTSDGLIYGSDKALKFTIREYLKSNGEVLLATTRQELKEIKKGKTTKKNLQSLTLDETYIKLYGDKFEDEDGEETILKNLLRTPDVKLFGATFASKLANIGIHGAVQIGQGFNIMKDSILVEQPVLSPFRNSGKGSEDKTQTTIGSQTVTKECHYVYPFSVNPLVYRDYEEKLGEIYGFSYEDYLLFKKASLISATAYNSASKKGCDNEFAIFIEIDEKESLPNLNKPGMLMHHKDGDKSVFTCAFDSMVNAYKDKVKSIEIYYDPYTVEVIGNFNNAKYFNIFTGEELIK